MSNKDYKVLGIQEGTFGNMGENLNVLLFNVSEVYEDNSNPFNPTFNIDLVSTDIIMLDMDSYLATKMEIAAPKEEVISLNISDFLLKSEHFEGIHRNIYYHKSVYEPRKYVIYELEEVFSLGASTIETLQFLARELKMDDLNEENNSDSEFATFRLPLHSPLAEHIYKTFEIGNTKMIFNMANWYQYYGPSGKHCVHMSFKNLPDSEYVNEQINIDNYKCVFLDHLNHMALVKGIEQDFFPKPIGNELLVNDKYLAGGFKVYIKNRYFDRLLNKINKCYINNNFPKLGIRNEKPSDWISFKIVIQLAKRPHNFNRNTLIYHFLSA